MRSFVFGLCLLSFLAGGCGRDEPSRVLVLGLDGMDPATVDLLISEGKLPNFARLRQEGAYGRLLSQKPLLSPVIWTTIATGKTPDLHGIGHFTALDPQGHDRLPVTSRMRRVKALWNIASEAGRSVAVVGWWATWPPEEVRGTVVSDRTAYHFLFEDGFTGGRPGEAKTYPPEVAEEIAPLLRRPGDLAYEELGEYVHVSREEFARPFAFEDDLGHFKWALATAESYRDVGLELWRTERPDLALVYIEGVDSTSHLFGHLFRAEGLSGELAAQQERFGGAVEAMYRFADDLVGRYLGALDERSTLVVLSDHGFELGVLHDDPSRTRDMRRVSERYHREEGILYLYGHGVRPYRRLARARIVDVAPTVLALLGIPPGRDMPGRVLSEALVDDGDVERIATYEEQGGRVVAGGEAGTEAGADDEAVLRHLESLGYLGGGEPRGEAALERSPEGERNLAAIDFQAGRYAEAAAAFRKLAAEEPGDATLRASLAGALGALGRYDEALAELDLAIELEPLNVEAYHNRAAVHERRGEIAAAIADYRTAVRYGPDYEPSRQALLRLTGSAGVGVPAGEAEREAAGLAEAASRAAHRGAYDEAMEFLDRAETIAPDYALLYQYRANVAYLMGDSPGAIAALERALELEPDNALFSTNLERLRDQGSDR